MGYKGYQVVASTWVILAICTLMVAARLYVQATFRFYMLRESFVVFAWLCFLGLAVCTSMMNDLNYYMHQGWKLDTPEEIRSVYIILNLPQPLFYKMGLYASLGSLLCFYFDLAPRVLFPRTWWGIVWGSVFVGAAAVWSLCYQFMRCLPRSFFYMFSTDGHDCDNVIWLQLINYGLQLASDLVVFTIPFFLLGNLKSLSWKAKAGTLAIFALAFWNVLMVAIQISFFAWGEAGHHYSSRNDLAQNWYAAQQWLYTLQPGTMIIIVCAPYVRRLWNGMSAEAMGRREGVRTPDSATPEVLESGVTVTKVATGDEEVVVLCSPEDVEKGMMKKGEMVASGKVI